MALFVEDSDEDSIKTDTTDESDHSTDSNFNVEQILAEWKNPKGVTVYLVKWEGYPLHRCTFEPREMFVGDATLTAWEARKRDAANGGEELFNVDEYHEAYERAEYEKELKHERRKAKRKKRREVCG